jgi:hypothetical protein
MAEIDPHIRCTEHKAVENQIKVNSENIKCIKEDLSKMRFDINALKTGTMSPLVMAAIVTTFGTIFSAVAGVAGSLIVIYAKSFGWL